MRRKWLLAQAHDKQSPPVPPHPQLNATLAGQLQRAFVTAPPYPTVTQQPCLLSYVADAFTFPAAAQTAWTLPEFSHDDYFDATLLHEQLLRHTVALRVDATPPITSRPACTHRYASQHGGQFPPVRAGRTAAAAAAAVPAPSHEPELELELEPESGLEPAHASSTHPSVPLTRGRPGGRGGDGGGVVGDPASVTRGGGVASTRGDSGGTGVGGSVDDVALHARQRMARTSAQFFQDYGHYEYVR